MRDRHNEFGSKASGFLPQSQKRKGSAFLAQLPNGMIVLRVIIKRQKMERGLFVWPSFDASSKMIAPTSDPQYLDRLKECLKAIETAKTILACKDVASIKDFANRWDGKPVATYGVLCLEELLHDYLEVLPMSKSTIKTYKGRAQAIVAIIGNLRVSEIRAHHLCLIDAKYKDHSRNSAALCHSVLSGALKFAIDRGDIQQTPYISFKCSVKKKPINRTWASSNAIDALFRHWQGSPESSERKAMQLYLIQAYTGARYSDASKLTKEDFERGYYTSQKTCKKSRLCLSERLQLLCPKSPLSMSYSSYRIGLVKVSEKLGFDYTRSHAARRFFATKIFESTGYNLKVVQDALGHSSIATTEKYILPDCAALEVAIKSLGRIC